MTQESIEIKIDSSYFKDSDATYLIYAYKDGYVPSTKTLKIGDNDSYSIDFIINPIKEHEVVLEIEPKVHHLGDDSYSGTINSQFQKNTEGISFEKSFYISSKQYNNYDKAILKFEGKGLQNDDNELIIYQVNSLLNFPLFFKLMGSLLNHYQVIGTQEKSIYNLGRGKLGLKIITLG